MKQTTKRLFSIVLSLFFTAGAFLLFFNFIRPVYTEVQALKAEVSVRERFVTNQQQSVRKVQQLISSYNNQTELRNLVGLTLPLEQDVSGAFAQLAGIAQNETLGAESFQITAEQAGDYKDDVRRGKDEGPSLTRPTGTLGFQVSFTGSYDNLKNFLAKIQSNVRIFDITTLSVVPLQKSTQDIYHVEASVTTYYQR